MSVPASTPETSVFVFVFVFVLLLVQESTR